MAELVTTSEVETPVETPEAPVTPEAPSTEEQPPVTLAEPVVVTPTPVETDGQRKHRSAQQRIDRIAWEKGEVQRELDLVKQERDVLKAAQTAPSDSEPRAEDFSTTEEWMRALNKWEVKEQFRQSQVQAEQDFTRREQARQREEADRAIAMRLEPQIDKARIKYPDFDEVTSAPIYGAMTQQLLSQSPHGAEIAYYLGTQPHEADKINAMAPVDAARAIVKLEQRFQAPPPKSVSSAPAPITPVTGTVGPAKDPENMTTEEWMAWNKQQKLERLKANPFA